MAGRHSLAIWVALATGAAAPAAAESSFLIPIGRSPIELGTAWSTASNGPRGDPGTCVESESTEPGAGEVPSYSLVTLSRAGGRLVLGVYVSVPIATDTLKGARLTDAARRMAASQPDSFRGVCGDGFIAAVTRGASYIAELEVDPRDASRATQVLDANQYLGTTPDRDRFKQAIESVTTQFHVVARELPGGSHAAATPVVPAAMLRRALATSGAVTEDSARPYLAAFVAYPKDAATGVEIGFGEGFTREREAAQVFLWDRRGTGVGTAGRAADLRMAQSHADSSSQPAPPAPPGQSDRTEHPASAAPGGARSEAQSAEPSEVNRLATAQQPATGQRAEGERGSSGLAGAQRPPLHPQAALVFSTPTGVEVYATTEAPPGVYSELVGHRRYWVPGAADGTASVKDAIRSASAGSAPARGTTILSSLSGVVLTDAAPVAGVHSEAAGSLHAWIAGVAAPSPEEQQALAAAARAAAAR
ncbi:MAG TPA: hypothetical protein VMH82_00465 [Myxococcota bacterium]|nr:hypothetical protein [Myxococcota bacterium]